MIDYPAARAVALVVQTGSFEAAARALNVTPSAVSQRVRQLEDRLGAVLIDRGQPCTATDTGARLCRHMEQVGLLERDLIDHLPGLVQGAAGPVTVSLATNADSLATWFLPAIAGVARDTGFLFDIALDDEDNTADWLRSGRVVAAVTALDRPVPGCTIRPLGALRFAATASPAFVARHFSQGVTAAALARAPALTHNHKDRLQQHWARQVAGQPVALATHWLPSAQGFVDATLAGMGWAMNPRLLVADHLAQGRLVELVPGTPLDRPLFWQITRLAAPRLKPLTAAVTATARRLLEQG